MSSGGKGSRPRPITVDSSTYAENWDRIFGKKDQEEVVAEPECYCYNCNKDRVEDGIPYVLTRMIVCPTCGNKRCPCATDHNCACTDSNEANQPGSRY